MSTTPATVYKIANWHDLYESKDSRRTTGPMKWIPVVTKTDGFGFGLLRQEKNRVQLLAAWYLMLGVAAKQPRELRGSLMRDGQPLTADDLELMTGFPADIFSAAFSFFTQPRQGWLVKEVCGTTAASCGTTAASCATTSAVCGTTAASCALQYITLQDRIGQDIRLDDSKTETGACAPPPVISSTASPSQAPEPAAKAGAQTDAQWLAELAASPAYRGIDVKREHAKALVWADLNKKTMNRRRFVNWLNRCEPTMAPQQARALDSRPIAPEPDGWRAWLNENAPDSVYSRGGAREGEQWANLDRSTQDWLTKQTARADKFQRKTN